ncbi:MAG: hypothetical protein BWY74_02346 [Firmicutes bacterium ADurb.Bin419]|nr:MAG: hypothetical protein BWY74_02346 [Firmicutes bacterium ADurb.Bin419]
MNENGAIKTYTGKLFLAAVKALYNKNVKYKKPDNEARRSNYRPLASNTWLQTNQYNECLSIINIASN